MPFPLTVVALAHRPDLIPTVKSWFVSEWPTWYGSDGPGDVDKDINSFAATDSNLPIALVVLEDNKAVGIGALKPESIPTHAHLGPWAAAGYVVPGRRGQGIGAVLLDALVSKAGALGFPHVYCGTSKAMSLLERSGWELIATTQLQGKPLGVYRSAA